MKLSEFIERYEGIARDADNTVSGVDRRRARLLGTAMGLTDGEVPADTMNAQLGDARRERDEARFVALRESERSVRLAVELATERDESKRELDELRAQVARLPEYDAESKRLHDELQDVLRVVTEQRDAAEAALKELRAAVLAYEEARAGANGFYGPTIFKRAEMLRLARGGK